MFEHITNFVAGAEWLWIIVIVAVLIFGAKKIPELAKTLGKVSTNLLSNPLLYASMRVFSHPPTLGFPYCWGIEPSKEQGSPLPLMPLMIRKSYATYAAGVMSSSMCTYWLVV